MKWQAVYVTRDSVSGIPYEEFVYCRNCRRTLPRSRVDSMKVAYRTFPQHVAETVGIIGLVSVALLAEAVVCSLVPGTSSDC